MIKRICKTCNKIFYVFPCRLKKSSCNYCSLKCVPHKENNNPNWKGGLIDRICKYCGKNFKVKRKQVKHGYGNYCSIKCARKASGKIISDEEAINAIKEYLGI